MPISTSPTFDPPPPSGPSDAGHPAQTPPGADLNGPVDSEAVETKVNIGQIIRNLDDAERVEQPWRAKGRDIVRIYRNASRATTIAASSSQTYKGKNIPPGPITFNILYSNTEVMAPAIYEQPPKPVVRPRFTAPDEAMELPPPMPPMMGPPSPGPFPGGPPMMGSQPSGPIGGPPPPAQPPGPPLGAGLPPLGPPGPNTMMPLAPPSPMMPPMMPPAPPPPANVPGVPGATQRDVETAASVMERALNIVLSDEGNDIAAQNVLQDTLLPGRGALRVRWKPVIKALPVEDPMSGEPMLDETGEPATEEKKVWETVGDEYVYWEDLLIDPVRQAIDVTWMSFRHLFTEDQVKAEFSDSPQFQQWLAKTQGKMDDLLKWTEKSAAASSGGGTRLNVGLGDSVRKAMVWEYWDREKKRVIWFCRDGGGVVLRVDPDPLKLEGFFPMPPPLLAVTTTDQQVPVPYYVLYENLANDLDETSKRISALTRQVKVRGAYNGGAGAEIKSILRGDDQTMVAVAGIDFMQGGLANHIWLVPIDMFVNALNQLYQAREQLKVAIYEVMGISDIMRGASNPNETATAQRIKGSMGVGRLKKQRQLFLAYVRDAMRLKAEIIANNFDAETLSAMTGEEVTDGVMAILRSDFQRTCSIDVETDSTIQPDQQEQQQSNAAIMQAFQAVMGGAAQMMASPIVQAGVIPPTDIMEMSMQMLKMFLLPIPNSRGVIEVIDGTCDRMAQRAALPPPPPPMMMGPPPGGPPPGPGGPPPPQQNGQAGPPQQPPPPVPGGPPAPPMLHQ